MEMVEFLRARFDEDEQAARREDEDCADTTLLPTYDSDHQARWNTERVLREVEAKRRLLELHHPTPGGVSRDMACNECSYGLETLDWADDYPCTTVRLLALPYADHPDYDEAWRPQSTNAV